MVIVVGSEISGSNLQETLKDRTKLTVYQPVAGILDAPTLDPDLIADPLSVGSRVVGTSPPHLHTDATPSGTKVGVSKPPRDLVEVEHVL